MKSLTTLGLTIGGFNYLFTAGYFFSNGKSGLGLIQLLVPPAELVLPWLAHPVLGFVSLVSVGLLLAGSLRTNVSK